MWKEIQAFVISPGTRSVLYMKETYKPGLLEIHEMLGHPATTLGRMLILELGLCLLSISDAELRILVDVILLTFENDICYILFPPWHMRHPVLDPNQFLRRKVVVASYMRCGLKTPLSVFLRPTFER